MKRIITFLLFCGLLITASSVLAQRKDRVSKEDEATQQAAALYRLGAEEYLRGNYVDALALFRQGYDLKPNSMFLYNISLVYGKLDNYSEALRYAEMADEDDLPPEAWARNMPRILAYRMAIQSQDIIAARGRCVSDQDCEDGWICSPAKMCEVASEGPVLVSQSESASKPTWVGWTGLTLTAGGAAFLTLALLKNFEVADLAESYDERRLANDVDGANAKRQEVEDAQSQGQIFLYAGAGLAAAGLGLFIYDLVRETEPALSFIPIVNEDGVGVWATGNF